MWTGVSIFDPTWQDVEGLIRKDGEKMPDVGQGERLLWLGQPGGRYAPFAYFPTRGWIALYLLVSSLLFALYAGVASKISTQKMLMLIFIISVFAIIVLLFILIIIYRQWYYTGRKDFYLVTTERIYFHISAGEHIFPWSGAIYEVYLRRIIIARNKSNTFSIPIRRLSAVEVRRLPYTDVGNIYLPGWADDRHLRSVTKDLFVYDERASARANVVYQNKATIQIGPRCPLRPSAMYSISQASRVGDLMASLMQTARNEERGAD